MKRKALIISIIAIIISLFSISYTFAANGKMDNVANGIRNFVGGAENIVEDAGSAVGNTVRDGMNTIGNGAKDVENAGENIVGTATDDNRDDNGYTATRTSGTVDGNDGAGASTNMYVWWIVAVTAVGIIVLLWSYFREKSQNNMYIDSNDR